MTSSSMMCYLSSVKVEHSSGHGILGPTIWGRQSATVDDLGNGMRQILACGDRARLRHGRCPHVQATSA